ncbi:MAG: hypothetical protein Q9201_007089 [Fulgogasparrea decipioides]
MSSLAYFLLFLLILIPLLFLAYIFYTRLSAQRAGRSPPPFSSFIPFTKTRSHNYSSSPSSSSGGILSTIRSKISSFTGTSSSQRPGAYEQPLGSHPRRGRGLDPDGAWDTRVGDEADAYGSGGFYEEQELGLRSGGRYGGHGSELPDYGDEEMGRGRSVSRDGAPPGFIGGDQRGLDERYERQFGGAEEDPFGDQAERSELRGVSPRPETGAGKGHGQKGSESVQGDSPTERRSMFHENM